MKQKLIIFLLCIAIYIHTADVSDHQMNIVEEIELGYMIHKALSKNEPYEVKGDYRCHVQALVCWMYIVGKKPFSEGTLVVQDTKKSSIWKFLESCPDKYARSSAHFTYVPGTQFGLDIAGLPTQTAKRTVLFGRAGNELIFIKPENWGTATWGHYIMHALELPLCVARKIPYLQYVVGSDDAVGYHKERIPNDVWHGFVSLITQYKTLCIDEDLLADEDVVTKASQRGIAYMVSVLNQLKVDDEDLSAKISDFIGEMQKKFDHLDERFGNEVVITLDAVQRVSSSSLVQQLAQEFLRRYQLNICA